MRSLLLIGLLTVSCGGDETETPERYVYTCDNGTVTDVSCQTPEEYERTRQDDEDIGLAPADCYRTGDTCECPDDPLVTSDYGCSIDVYVN